MSTLNKPNVVDLVIESVPTAVAGIPCQQSLSEATAAVRIHGDKTIFVSFLTHLAHSRDVLAVAATTMEDNDKRELSLVIV